MRRRFGRVYYENISDPDKDMSLMRSVLENFQYHVLMALHY